MAVLRRPLGLTLTEEELADDALRQHFCAISYGVLVGTLSLKPLDEGTLQLEQMAVAENRQLEGIGSRLLDFAEDWARDAELGDLALDQRVSDLLCVLDGQRGDSL